MQTMNRKRKKKVCIEWKTLCATAVLSVCPVLSCNKYLYRQSLAKLLIHCSNSVPSLHAHPSKEKKKITSQASPSRLSSPVVQWFAQTTDQVKLLSSY